MRLLRILAAAVMLLCATAQVETAHDHHCLVEKAACSACRITITPFAATPAAAHAVMTVAATVLAIAAPADAHDESTACGDAFRLRAPPLD